MIALPEFKEHKHLMFNLDYKVGQSGNNQEERPPTQESDATTATSGRPSRFTLSPRSSNFVKYFNKLMLPNREIKANINIIFNYINFKLKAVMDC